MQNQKYYAGIGSRQTPPIILDKMTRLSKLLSKSGFVCRTGSADGADRAFMKGSKSIVYLPWPSFNSIWRMTHDPVIGLKNPTEDAIILAGKFHHAWHLCTRAVRRLHGRNAHIILGEDLEQPVSFVVCFTKSGKPEGGTALGMAIASHYNIPIFNYGDPNNIINKFEEPEDFVENLPKIGL